MSLLVLMKIGKIPNVQIAARLIQAIHQVSVEAHLFRGSYDLIIIPLITMVLTVIFHVLYFPFRWHEIHLRLEIQEISTGKSAEFGWT